MGPPVERCAKQLRFSEGRETGCSEELEIASSESHEHLEEEMPLHFESRLDGKEHWGQLIRNVAGSDPCCSSCVTRWSCWGAATWWCVPSQRRKNYGKVRSSKKGSSGADFAVARNEVYHPCLRAWREA